MSKINFELIFPDGVYMQKEIDSIRTRGKKGELAVLPEHTPFLTSISKTTLIIESFGNEERVDIDRGLLEVTKEKVSILAFKAKR